MSFEASFRVDIGQHASITSVRTELLNFSRLITFARRVETAVWNVEAGVRIPVDLFGIAFREPVLEAEEVDSRTVQALQRFLDQPLPGREPSKVETNRLSYNSPLTLHVEGVADIIPAIIRAFVTIGPTYRKAKAEADEAEIRRDALRDKEADTRLLRTLLVDEVERSLASDNRRVPVQAVAALLDNNLTEALVHLADKRAEVDVEVK